MKFLYSIKQNFYKILVPAIVTASGMVSCNPFENPREQFSAPSEHHVYVTLDLDKFYINTYDNLSAAFLELENEIDWTLQEHDVSRVVIKVAHKDIAQHLTANDWRVRFRDPLLAIEEKYGTLSDPVHIYGNDTLPWVFQADTLKDTDVGITKADARVLRRIGFVFESKEKTQKALTFNTTPPIKTR